MSRTTRLLPLAALGAATALAGCGGSDTSAVQSATATGAPAATSAVSTPAATTTAAGTSDHGGHSAGSGHGGHSPAPTVATDGPKPARQQVLAGLQRYYQGIARVTGVPEHRYDAMSICVVDAMYDKAQVQTVNALQAGALTRVHPSDGPQVAQVTADCAERTVAGAAPTSPTGGTAPGASSTGSSVGEIR